MRDCDGKRRMSSIVKISGRVDQAMQHQPMLRRIDGRNAAMMALVEQPVRRDDAVEILQRRPAGGRDVLLAEFFEMFLTTSFSNGDGAP